jgi:hypothetical protein
MPRRCPPGMVCFPDTFSVISWPSIILILIFLITIGMISWSYHRIPVIVYPQQQSQVKINVAKGDDRYSRSPEPSRVWDMPPDITRVSTEFNIPTQGLPEEYQSMGIVKMADGKLLPLFGRRSISSRERYNYYTRTDSYNPLPLPIEIQGRDCQDQVGCPELFNGDRIKLSATNESGEVTIYKVRDIVR